MQVVIGYGLVSAVVVGPVELFVVKKVSPPCNSASVFGLSNRDAPPGSDCELVTV